MRHLLATILCVLSLLAVSLEAAMITNWGAQLPTASPNGGDVILMQQGGVTYFFTPNQLAANIATNVNSLIANKIANSSGRGTNATFFGLTGNGTATPTAIYTISNTTATTPTLAAYASNNPTATLFLGSNGNATIGTNFSLSKFHVRPDISGQSYFRVDDTNGTPRLQVGVLPGFEPYNALWFGNITPTVANALLYSDGATAFFNANSLTIQASGVSKVTVGSSSLSSLANLIFGTDNTYDIGAVNSTRPRNVHIAGSNTVNTVTIQGTTNQVSFGSTNIAPSSAATPTKWVSVRVAGDAGVYRIPLYE